MGGVAALDLDELLLLLRDGVSTFEIRVFDNGMEKIWSIAQADYYR